VVRWVTSPFSELCSIAGMVLVLVCNAATQLAIQLQQEYIQVVRINKEARKRPTEFEWQSRNVHLQMCNVEKKRVCAKKI